MAYVRAAWLDFPFREGGRDGSVRIWDMRTKTGIFVFTGHTNAICSLTSQATFMTRMFRTHSTCLNSLYQAAEPQFISGSMDRMVPDSSGLIWQNLNHVCPCRMMIDVEVRLWDLAAGKCSVATQDISKCLSTCMLSHRVSLSRSL